MNFSVWLRVTLFLAGLAVLYQNCSEGFEANTLHMPSIDLADTGPDPDPGNQDQDPNPDPDPEPNPNPTPNPKLLLQKDDLIYEGAFRLPKSSQGASRFDYAAAGMTYNPANNSLFVTGHDHQQMTAEISIPQIVKSNNETALDTAKVLQTFHDPVDGRRNSIGGGSGGGTKIGGYLVYNGNLHVTAFAHYDASAQQSSSHFVRPLNLATSGQVQGPFKLGPSSLPARIFAQRLTGRHLRPHRGEHQSILEQLI